MEFSTTEQAVYDAISEKLENEVSIYDIELLSGILRISLTKIGGIDLDSLARCNSIISKTLDESQEFGTQHYALEVSSPGLERNLRRSDHFSSSIGENVVVKGLFDGVKTRISGEIVHCGNGFVEIKDDKNGEIHTLEISNITQAKTIFKWNSEDKSDNRTLSSAFEGTGR